MFHPSQDVRSAGGGLQQPAPAPTPVRPPMWGPASARWSSPLAGRFGVFAVLKVVALAVGYFAALICALFAVSFFREGLSTTALFIAILLGSSVVMGIGMWAFVVAPLGGRWDLIGWRPPARSMWNLLWQIPLVIVSALIVQISLIAPFTSAEPAEGAVEDVLVGTPLPVVAIAVTLICGVVPVWEELFFRGVVFGMIRTRLGRWGGAALAGCVFALVHLVVVGFPYLAVIGFSLCIMAEWYRSVVPGIILHSVNNALVAITLLTAAGAG